MVSDRAGLVPDRGGAVMLPLVEVRSAPVVFTGDASGSRRRSGCSRAASGAGDDRLHGITIWRASCYRVEPGAIPARNGTTTEPSCGEAMRCCSSRWPFRTRLLPHRDCAATAVPLRPSTRASTLMSVLHFTVVVAGLDVRDLLIDADGRPAVMRRNSRIVDRLVDADVAVRGPEAARSKPSR